MTTSCVECGGAADVTVNPPRYTLPRFHGKCRDCGHEWNFSGSEPDDRRLGM